MYRRTFIAGVVTALGATAGCLGSGHRAVAPDQWDFEAETSTEVVGSVTLPEGRYGAYQFRPSRPVTMAVEAHADAAIDVFFLDRTEYNDRYREGDQIQYHARLSTTDATDVDMASEVPAGDYLLCFDNSGEYGTAPEQTVTVAFEIRSV